VKPALHGVKWEAIWPKLVIYSFTSLLLYLKKPCFSFYIHNDEMQACEPSTFDVIDIELGTFW